MQSQLITYLTRFCTSHGSGPVGYEVQTLSAWDFPAGTVVKNLSCNAEDTSSILGWGTQTPHVKRPKPESPHAKSKEPECHN